MPEPDARFEEFVCWLESLIADIAFDPKSQHTIILIFHRFLSFCGGLVSLRPPQSNLDFSLLKSFLSLLWVALSSNTKKLQNGAFFIIDLASHLHLNLDIGYASSRDN